MMGLPISRKQMVLVAAIVLTATAGSVGFDYVNWLGSWGETTRALEDSTVLNYPIIAAIAAWFMSGPKRRRYQWMIATASRSAYGIYLRTAVSLTASAAAGLLLVAMASLSATATQASFGRPEFVPILTVVAGLFAAVGFGSLVATLVPSVLSAVVSLALVYAVEVVVDPSKTSMRPLAGLVVSDSRERTYRTTAAWMLEVRGIWLIALGLIFVACGARAASKWFLPFVVVCLAAVPLILAGDTGMAINNSALRPVCHQPNKQVTICLTAARDHTYSSVWSALRPELALLPGLAKRQWRISEEILVGQQTRYKNGQISLPLGLPNGVNGDAHVINRQQLQADFSSRLLQSNCQGPARAASNGQQPDATVQDVIQAWLLTRLDIPIDSTTGFEFPQLGSNSLNYGAVGAFREEWNSASSSERQIWLKKYGKTLVDCRLRTATVALP